MIKYNLYISSEMATFAVGLQDTGLRIFYQHASKVVSINIL